MKKYSDSTLKGFTKDFLIKTIRCLENNLEDCEYRNENQFRILCQMDLERAKYRWHDLRKDPNDLPEIDPDLLPISKRVYFSTKDDAYTGTYDHLLETWDSDGLEGFAVSEVVIAWREIEPFEG